MRSKQQRSARGWPKNHNICLPLSSEVIKNPEEIPENSLVGRQTTEEASSHKHQIQLQFQNKLPPIREKIQTERAEAVLTADKKKSPDT